MRHHRLQERDVLADQLLLKADGVGGDDNAEVLLRAGSLDGGYQIRKRLPHARAGLDQQLALPLKSIGDRLGHLELLSDAARIRRASRR